MIRSYSFQELPKLLRPMAPAGFLVSFTANSISNLIKTTKGKEKLLSLAQYCAELFKLTMLDYVRQKHISNYPIHLLNAISVEKSMKNGRKLMRVLMFTDDLGAIEKYWENRDRFTYVDGLQVCLNIANIIYYILDNLVWCADIGIISKFIAHANIRWKDTKDMSSLARCIFGLVISLITSFQSFERIKTLKSDFINRSEKKITKDHKYYFKTEALIDSRREYRFKALEVFINILRFFMLGHALGLPVLKKFSKIFIATCGIVSTALSIFNGIIGEQIVRLVQKQTSQASPLIKDKNEIVK